MTVVGNIHFIVRMYKKYHAKYCVNVLLGWGYSRRWKRNSGRTGKRHMNVYDDVVLFPTYFNF